MVGIAVLGLTLIIFIGLALMGGIIRESALPVREDLDTINPTVLGLIGISAGTALGAAFITSNTADAETAAKPPLGISSGTYLGFKFPVASKA